MRKLELCPVCGNPAWHQESAEGTHSMTTLDGATYKIFDGRLYRESVQGNRIRILTGKEAPDADKS